MKNKKILLLALLSLIGISMLSGCGATTASITQTEENKIRIVCTTFPQYDWVRQIIKGQEEQFELTLLLENGTDLHNYQPTADDMIKISSSDLFLYIGGESDRWVDDALQEAVNQNLESINLMEALGSDVKEEEIVEGMQEEDHHDHDGHDDHDEEEEEEYDEHIWLSLRNAKKLVGTISSSIIKLDPTNASLYEQNTASYLQQLTQLDSKYTEVLSQTARQVLLFGDRFPFRYLVDDYGLDYYAAFVGCTTETEASFETIAFLVGKVEEENLPFILVTEGSDKKIATSIINNSNRSDTEILVLNSMQSVTKTDIEDGITYLSIMTDNLDTLEQALN